MDDCKLVAKMEKPDETFASEIEKHHGRMEQRTAEIYRKFTATDEEWNYLLEELIVVKRSRQVFDTKNKGWIDTSEISYYVSDISLSAEKYNSAIRGHWGVENRNHHVRDNSMGEDKSRIRINPINMAILRSWSMNILRKNKVKNIAVQLYKNTLNTSETIAYNGIKNPN